jgi:hypothetical protein
MSEVIGNGIRELSSPTRIQLSRRKGWRLPEGAVRVSRPGAFGNPFTREAAIESGYATDATWQEFVVECFRDWLGPSQSGRDWWQGPQSDGRRKAILNGLPSLRGKSLACWCKPGAPCHADVLLELANRPVCEPCLGSGRSLADATPNPSGEEVGHG